MEATVRPDIWQRRHAVVFNLAVSFNYHRKRQRFFDLLDKGTKATTVLVGASLFGEQVKQVLPLAAALVSSLGLLSLVFGYGDRKQAHKELGEAFMQLQAQIDLVGPATFTEAQLTAWEAELARINSREPPNLRALVTICQNEQAVAMGHKEFVHPLAWHKRMLASWVSFDGQ